MKKSLSLLILFAMIFVSDGGSVEAAITINDDFKGTLVLTSPEGEIELIDEGDQVPQIKIGSLVEMFDGMFKLSTEADDQVEAACLGASLSVGGGSSISLTCGEESGFIEVLAGIVKIVNEQGEIIELKAGESMNLLLDSAVLAAPTAERGRGLGRDRDKDEDADDNDDDDGDDDDQGDDNDNQDDDSSPE